MVDYADMYQWKDPLPHDRPVTTHANPLYIDDETPTKGDIEAAVRQTRRNRPGRHTHLRT